MNIQSIPYKKMVLVCGNVREDGRKSCGPQGGMEFKQRLKEICKAKGLPVRVVQTSCLGQCDHGPNIMIQPDGVWVNAVTWNDIDEIVKLIEKDIV